MFIETIRIQDGHVCHLSDHTDRMRRTADHFGFTAPTLPTDLASLVPDELRTGTVRCRVVYDHTLREVTFTPYRRRHIERLFAVDAGTTTYAFKYADRAPLARLDVPLGASDELLFVRDGYLTDTSYANLVLRRGRELVTPDTFLLDGTCRRRLSTSISTLLRRERDPLTTRTRFRPVAQPTARSLHPTRRLR